MILIYKIAAAFVLVSLTLWLQCGGLVALIAWVRRGAPEIDELRPLHSAVLVVRITTAMIALQGLEVLLWAAGYRCPCSLLSGASLDRVGQFESMSGPQKH